MAELKPEQVAVLVNKRSPESVELGRYYVEQRHIPAENLIELDLPVEESIDRDAYDNSLVLPLRAAFEEKKITRRARVLVTTYGVPLKVNAPEARGDEQEALLEAYTYQKNAREKLYDLIKRALRLQGKNSGDAKQEKGETDSALVERANQAIREAAGYIKELGDSPKVPELRQQLNLILSEFGGIAAIVQSVKIPEGAANSEADQTLQKLRRDLQTAQKVLHTLDETRTPVSRKRAYPLTSQAFGAVGLLGRADAYVKMYQYKDADASVDSELSLLWWDRNHYLVSDRLPNPLHHKYSAPGHNLVVLFPTMMVSRIDAPTLFLAKRMIDQSIQAEKTGLEGKAYIDARGAKIDDEKFGQFDQSLRDTASLIGDKTGYKVEVDNRDERFSKPGDAPDTALYCGWYRLRNYEDAFTFKPGAIGYHIASEEAVSLHAADEKGWCKNALDHGITATLGAVAEPYLDSFPLPLEFFGLLLTGRYTLIDAYALTSPYISWRMVLIGDPLYKPTFKDSKVTGEDLEKISVAAKTLSPLPPAPSDSAFEDPLVRRKAYRDYQQNAETELDGFYKVLEEKLKAKQPAAPAATPANPEPQARPAPKRPHRQKP